MATPQNLPRIAKLLAVSQSTLNECFTHKCVRMPACLPACFVLSVHTCVCASLTAGFLRPLPNSQLPPLSTSLPLPLLLPSLSVPDTVAGLWLLVVRRFRGF